MAQDSTKDWQELCKAAANEVDPEKLLRLIAELTTALDERDRNRKTSRNPSYDQDTPGLCELNS